MDKVRFYHDKYYAQANRELSQIQVMQSLEQRTGVPKVYLAAGVGLFGLLLVALNFAATLITNLVGFVYPAWSSFHAIETPGKEDDTQWLTYWTVFGLFNVVEYFTNVLLYWVPFYYTLKLVVLLWLALPHTRGAEYLYQNYLRPVFLRHSASFSSTVKTGLSPRDLGNQFVAGTSRAAESLKAHDM
ncbi:ER membrane protein DP1/Yop1 [Tieghemiomyces parasiticus]|uniref:Protein YOP1 n=1 Tax=Tieghemiomyces parasiticus TaxID=78921 RepID=A0A9W8AI14_9FUNG|nr:ER membrane protein DP1/Yop1 [Tieghemiomyces parasiticus]